MKNLQKQLFLEEMQLMHGPGWDSLQQQELLAFKSSVVPVPFMNFVYGPVSIDACQVVKQFYGKQPFFWLLENSQSDELLLEQGFTGPDLTFEMGMTLADYHSPTVSSHVEVVEATQDLATWIKIAATWLNIAPAYVDQFFTPWIRTGKFTPYLGLCNKKPAATSLVYCGHLGAALYCLGTIPTYRKQGLGTALTHACLHAAKQRGIALKPSSMPLLWANPSIKKSAFSSPKQYENIHLLLLIK